MKTSTYVSKKPDADGYVSYTSEEHDIWSILYHRQRPLVEGRACQSYIDGLSILDMSQESIPQIPDINKRMTAATGWSIEPVAALIGFDKFFGLLANRKFPAATFIRRRDELQYLQEPDIFHEIFGHCPMLTNQTYADFMQAYGEIGVHASPYEQKMLAALYWFTVEFGLIQTAEGLRIYGGGILSSIGETTYALESPKPIRQPFSIVEALRTPYRIDIFQPVYFMIDSYQMLYDLTQANLLDEIAKAKTMGMREPLFDLKDQN